MHQIILGNLIVVLESEFDFMMRIIFAGKVYNLTYFGCYQLFFGS